MVVHPDSDQVPRDWPYSGYSHESYLFRIRDFHPLWCAFPDTSTTNMISNSYTEVLQPPSPLLLSKQFLFNKQKLLDRKSGEGFGLFRFRSPLLSESLLIYFPWVTKMVQFSQYFLTVLYIHTVICRHYSTWVSPFGNQRINACLQLPVAFRSLPRPSSSHGA